MRNGIALLCMGLAATWVAATASGGQPARKRRGPYKRTHIQGMKLLDAGEHAKALTFFQDYLAAQPDDLEAHFGLAAAQAGTGDAEAALATVRKAVEAGLPLGRFVAGPRGWLKPLTDTKEFRDLVREKRLALVHGPMPGAVTSRSARFWIRTATASPVKVVLGRGKPGTEIESAPQWTSQETDFTAVLEVTGLSPATRYFYDVVVDGKSTLAPRHPSFRTFPSPNSRARFRVGFGGGAGYVPQRERMWTTIRGFKPLAFLFLGDNVYIDLPKMPEMQRYCYYRRQSRPEYRDFVAATPIYAVWDDHDFGTNDCIPGPEIDDPPWKVPVWKVFCQNWVNPYYGGGDKAPGCWFHFTIGDVDFFMTDSRFYRSNPRKPNPSMLGPAQKQWLLDRLKESRATFKVLANGVPWATGTKPGSLDTWDGFKDERKEIFDFIEQNKIPGVILLSADRHRSDVWKLKRSVGYPLYEFETSRLTNQHVHAPMEGALFSYNKKQAFGLLTFDTRKDDPEVTYRIFTIDGEEVHSITLRRSQLTPRGVPRR